MSFAVWPTGCGWWASSLRLVGWLKLNGQYIEAAGGVAPTENYLLRSVSHISHSSIPELEQIEVAVRLRQGAGSRKGLPP